MQAPQRGELQLLTPSHLGVEMRHLTPLWPADDELAHVENVENRDLHPHSGVLIVNGGVVDRHVPTGKGDQFLTESHVGHFKRGAFQFRSHAANFVIRA